MNTMQSISQLVTDAELRFKEEVRGTYTAVLFQIAQQCPGFAVNKDALERLGVDNWKTTLKSYNHNYDYYENLVSYKDAVLAVGNLSSDGIVLKFPAIQYATCCYNYDGWYDLKSFNSRTAALTSLTGFERTAFIKGDKGEQPSIEDVLSQWTHTRTTTTLTEFWLSFVEAFGPMSESLEKRYKKFKADQALQNLSGASTRSQQAIYKFYLKNRGIPMLAKWNATYHPSR